MSSHWDRMGGAYEQEWQPPAKQALSRLELDFVRRHLAGSPARRVLDVGIGAGRVLGTLLDDDRVEHAVGIDASSEMVDACRQRFAGDPKLEAVLVRDVARDGPPEGPFDFVTAIRVLKYEVRWRAAVAALVGSLGPGGVLVFTMPNRRSLNAVARRYAVPWHTASRAELVDVARRSGAEILESTAFTKLPFFTYNRPKHRATAAIAVGFDRALDRVLGRERLGRELFVALRAPG